MKKFYDFYMAALCSLSAAFSGCTNGGSTECSMVPVVFPTVREYASYTFDTNNTTKTISAEVLSADGEKAEIEVGESTGAKNVYTLYSICGKTSAYEPSYEEMYIIRGGISTLAYADSAAIAGAAVQAIDWNQEGCSDETITVPAGTFAVQKCTYTNNASDITEVQSVSEYVIRDTEAAKPFDGHIKTEITYRNADTMTIELQEWNQL